MKILVATNNMDKFNIISKMIYSIFGNNIKIKSLASYKDFVEVDEVGNNINRAKEKAKNAKNNINDEFDYVLGIDDGVIVNETEYVSVKDKLNDIICNNTVSIGSKIYITRAYYLLSKTNKETYCYNKIPYIIQKKLSNYEKQGYPLNSVISTIDDDRVLTERTEEELNKYFLKYSIDDLRKLFNNYDLGGK